MPVIIYFQFTKNKLFCVNINKFIFLGTAGGYLGLFLGYAILNIPDLILDAHRWIKGRLRQQ